MRLREIACLAGTVFVLLMAARGEAGAQLRDRLDNRGTGFWIAFMPTNGFDLRPLLALSVACERPTTGRLIYTATGRTETITIADANTPVRIDLDTDLVYNPDPGISDRSVRLEFDDEVSIYGINTMRWSSDAFVALPDEALGSSYRVLSYPNTLQPSPFGSGGSESDFPSEMAIVGTSNQPTTVTIYPSVRTKDRPNTQPYTVSLSRGQVYIAQAAGEAGEDLTGTRIESTQPVVVYGGHQRTNVPYNDAVGRDHLVEQMIPLSHWQSRAMLLPHYQLDKTIADANIARVLASEDNTAVSVDSSEIARLNAGEFVEIPLDRAKLVTADHPVLVAQYQHSTVDERFITRAVDSIGDPFEMLVPSREQFDSAYAFESFQSSDFKQHFINVVIPSERTGSVRLDGKPLLASWSRIPKTSYSFTQLRVLSGEHAIDARVPFGLYVYGFGPYNSYGYPGGYVFDTLFKDQKEPLVSAEDTCGGLSGVAHDDSTHDFGMESLRVASSSNVRLVTEPFRSGDDSIRFRLDLLDPFEDGSAELIAVDTAGLDSHVALSVKGFTVAIQRGQTQPIRYDTLASLNGQQFCRSITLYNYGRYPQTINRLSISPSGPGLSVGTTFPIQLAPGEHRDVEVCFTFTGDTAFDVQVGIDNGCLERAIATIPVISGVDTMPPSIVRTDEPCQSDPSFDLSEPGLFNAGVAAIDPIRLINGTLEIVPASLPSKSVRLVIRRIDPRQDLIYTIAVRDMVGLTSTIEDTVGGFTLAVSSQSGRQLAIRLGERFDFQEMQLFDRVCDSVYLTNYGLLPMRLERVRMHGNVEFSIPPEQLPLTLQPGEERGLALCVTPRAIGESIDTLLIDYSCGFDAELVEVATTVDPLHGRTSDECGNDLSFNIGGFARRTFLAPPAPNPGTSQTALRFGLAHDDTVSLDLHNASGTLVRSYLDGEPLPGGMLQIEADVADIPSGVYYLRMRTASGERFTQTLVIRR